MTREEIEQMQAGNKMNSLVAMKVLNWSLTGDELIGCVVDGRQVQPGDVLYLSEDGDAYWSAPNFSERIEYAWQVVEKMRENKSWFGVSVDSVNEGYWVSEFVTDNDTVSFVSAETAPLAICRAALIAFLEAE